ncbi:hypothetical protein V8C34DRAFT_200454 [Trichoderma compactum]
MLPHHLYLSIWSRPGQALAAVAQRACSAACAELGIWTLNLEYSTLTISWNRQIQLWYSSWQTHPSCMCICCFKQNNSYGYIYIYIYLKALHNTQQAAS